MHDDPRKRRVPSLYTGALGSRRDEVMAAVQDYADDATWYSSFRDRLQPVHVHAG
jgi:hypothetical protein